MKPKNIKNQGFKLIPDKIKITAFCKEKQTKIPKGKIKYCIATRACPHIKLLIKSA